MKKVVRSARGASVDFDLLKLKQEISSTPPPTDVKQRQKFIESRLRRTRRVPAPAPKVAPVDVEPEMPSVEETQAMRNVPTPPPVQEKKKTTRTQKARPKTTDAET